MRKLIQLGADVNASAFCDFPRAGKPVLRYAIDSHSMQVICLLVEAGAKVDDITESPLIVTRGSSVRNLSLLSHAIRTKVLIAIIQQLLTYGAHIVNIWSTC